MKKIIIFDLEGPLSPMDHAYEVMKLNPAGLKVFEVLSRYDDLLTIEKREGYEPGNTLKLVTPFLIFWRINEARLIEVSGQAKLVDAADKLIGWLSQKNWQVFIASTSYEQHALNIAKLLGVPKENVFCTKFPLDKFQEAMKDKDLKWLDDIVFYITKLLWQDTRRGAWNDARIVGFLDGFYRELFEDNDWKNIFRKVKVCGGSRKVAALRKVCKVAATKLQDLVVIGDSITDFKMLKAVRDAGGLAIAFNANEYGLPYANVGFADIKLNELDFILEQWTFEGLDGVKTLCENVRSFCKSGPYYHWLEGKSDEELKRILELHKNFRAKVRGQATANLG